MPDLKSLPTVTCTTYCKCEVRGINWALRIGGGGLSLVEPGEAEMHRKKPTLEDYRDSAITFLFGGMLVFALVVGLVGSIGVR